MFSSSPINRSASNALPPTKASNGSPSAVSGASLKSCPGRTGSRGEPGIRGCRGPARRSTLETPSKRIREFRRRKHRPRSIRRNAPEGRATALPHVAAVHALDGLPVVLHGEAGAVTLPDGMYPVRCHCAIRTWSALMTDTMTNLDLNDTGDAGGQRFRRYRFPCPLF